MLQLPIRPPARNRSSVWADSLRLPMVKAYEKANPSVKLDVMTYDGDANGDGSLESKVALFNRIGHGWPDIVCPPRQNDVQTLGAAPFNFPATLNNGLVPTSISRITRRERWPRATSASNSSVSATTLHSMCCGSTPRS